MEAIAWEYVNKGDLNAASVIFTTLAQSAGGRQGDHRRMARLCRVLCNPGEVPLPHRHIDIVEALMESTLPTIAVFGPCMAFNEATRVYNKLVPHVHPDKNPQPRAAAAFHRLAEMKEECRRLLPATSATDAPSPSSPLTPQTPSAEGFDAHRGGKLRKRNDKCTLAKNSMQLTGLLQSMKQQGGCRLQCDLRAEAFEAERSTPVEESTVKGTKADGGVRDRLTMTDTEREDEMDNSGDSSLNAQTASIILGELRLRKDAGSMSASLCDTVSSSVTSALSLSPSSSFTTSAGARSTGQLSSTARLPLLDSEYVRRQRSVTLLRSSRNVTVNPVNSGQQHEAATVTINIRHRKGC